MSGSSLDGLDLVCCTFVLKDDAWQYEIEAASCIPYPENIAYELKSAFYKNPTGIAQLDVDYGKFLGQQIAKFIKKNNLNPDFVASHGHTIFHRPNEGYTLQIGDGQSIADVTGRMVINDFRTLDVKKGGQGAPLVPIGDRLLFSDYGICLNIGGIANLSFENKEERIAYDICIANQALNYLANQVGKEYDINGEMANDGEVYLPLLQQLNSLEYYQKPFPKSLGRESFEREILPLLLQTEINVKNIMRTFVEHIAIQIVECIEKLPLTKMLITGGGAFNRFLIEQISIKTKHQLIVPDSLTVNFKESIIFAFLGVLRFRNEINCLKSVTGAIEDSCCGLIHIPKV